MTEIILLSMSLYISLMIITTSNPLSMGLMLVLQTLMVCMLSGMMSKTFWLSYILLLVFLGGMLILFIYVITIASNEKFSFSTNSIYFFFLFMIFSTLTLSLLTSSNKSLNLNSSDLNPMKLINLTEEISVQIYHIYNFPNNMVNIILMLYLLTALIAVVKITEADQGALRSSN